jgi:hypothetical protein
MAVQQPPQQFKEGGLATAGAWTRKEGQNPEGGLNAKGRASLKAQGQDIKPPVSAKQAKKSPKAAARRSSFCARMGSMEGPMKDESGKPTRKALALRKWDCKAQGGMVEGYAATTRAKRKATAAGKQFAKQPKKVAEKTASFRVKG